MKRQQDTCLQCGGGATRWKGRCLSGPRSVDADLGGPLQAAAPRITLRPRSCHLGIHNSTPMNGCRERVAPLEYLVRRGVAPLRTRGPNGRLRTGGFRGKQIWNDVEVGPVLGSHRRNQSFRA